ncbi:MAG: Pycsar system effector family protein [candidate division Zixibacteria bacterium]
MENSLEYSRRLYENTLDWYKRAETKAQLVLTIDGAFLAFLTKAMFESRNNQPGFYLFHSPLTWVLLAMMVITLTGSLIAVLICVRSRLHNNKQLADYYRDLGVDVAKPDSYRPDVMGFFQMIARLRREGLIEKLPQVDEEFEVKALASQIYFLSINVEEEHRWVNLAFWLTGASLMFFFMAGISYLMSV